MTSKQQTQQLLNAVNQAILELVQGAASASVTSSSGSQTYTRADLGQLKTLRRDLRQELRAYAGRGRASITITGARFV